MRALFQILIGVATREHRGEQDDQHASTTTAGRRQSRTAGDGRSSATPSAWREQLERDRREQQHDLPVDLQRPEHLPDAAVAGSVKTNGEKCQIASFGHSSRRPPPAKPQPTAKGSAINSPVTSGGRPTMRADGRAGVRAGDQAGEERAFERQVGGVVAEQQAGDDAGRQRDAEAEREGQPIGPGAALEDQDVPEPPVAHQHRRQRGHDGQLDDAAS